MNGEREGPGQKGIYIYMEMKGERGTMSCCESEGGGGGFVLVGRGC